MQEQPRITVLRLAYRLPRENNEAENSGALGLSREVKIG